MNFLPKRSFLQKSLTASISLMKQILAKLKFLLSESIDSMSNTAKYPFKALVFEGGGSTAFGHQGAIEVFHENGLLPQIKYFAGSSSGSMMAAALACKGNPKVIRDLIMETDLKLLLDKTCFCRDLGRLATKYGWFKGDYLEAWVGEALKRITGNAEITFKEAFELTGNYLAITGVDMTSGDLVYMTHESTPDLTIKRAVRRSTALPLVYKPDIVKEDSMTKFYVDGGLIENYPIDYFDDRLEIYETVGFKLFSGSELTQINNPFINRVDPRPPRNLQDFLIRFLVMMMNRNKKMHVRSRDWSRSVKVNTGDRSSLDFNLDDDGKRELLNCGRSAAERFLIEWESTRLEVIAKDLADKSTEVETEVVETEVETEVVETETEMDSDDIETDADDVEMNLTEVALDD